MFLDGLAGCVREQKRYQQSIKSDTAHELILMICKAMGFLEGLLNYLRFLYEDNQCLYRGDDSDNPPTESNQASFKVALSQDQYLS